MDTGQIFRRKNPRAKANPISIIFFWWTKDLFMKGAKKDLEQTDMYEPLSVDESENATDRLEWYWKKELKKLQSFEYTVDQLGKKIPKKGSKKPSLTRAIINAFGAQYLLISCTVFLQAVILRSIQPLFQAWVINYFENKPGAEMTRNDAFVATACLVVCTLTMAVLMHHNSVRSQQMGMRVRVACSSLIYRKSLRVSRLALTQTGGGQIINMLSNDMSRFDQLPSFLHYLYIMPIQVLVMGYSMYQHIGNTTFIGIGSLLLFTIPTFSFFAKVSRRLREKTAPVTDRRVQLMNELINGIQVVKMYAWEKPFNAIVSMTRSLEIKRVTTSSYVRAMYVGIMVFTERTALFITLVSYALLGNNITADTTYILATYYNALQLSAALFFPQAIIISSEAVISIRRIEHFLLMEEVVPLENASSEETNNVQNGTVSKKEKTKVEETTEKYVIRSTEMEVEKHAEIRKPVNVELSRVSTNWVVGQLPPTLCDVSFKVEAGKLCTLVGTVGSGKSTILQLILRELPIGAGTLKILQNLEKNEQEKMGNYITDRPDLTISYASQDAWLYSGTVRDNILFGQPYDRTKYLAVTKACALSRDFKQLPNGDMTFTGEGGIKLSGGQKARVNLARAVYRDADLYLLDDPLSAVDTRVARHLFRKCIMGYLHNKTRILVTHQLQFVKKADTIVVLDRGSVKMKGTYDELSTNNTEFLNMLNQLKSENEKKEINAQKESIVERNLRRTSSKLSLKSTDSSSLASSDYDEDNDATAKNMEGEIIGRGNLKSEVYLTYFRHGAHYCTLVTLVILFLLAQISTSGIDYWVSYWTNLEWARNNWEAGGSHNLSRSLTFFNNTFMASIFSLDEKGLLTKESAIYIYTCCVGMCILLISARGIWFVNICMRANRHLHNVMFANLLHATMKFFNVNTSGRILNRFSKDIGVLDEQLPKCILESAQIGLIIVGILIIETIVNQWMIIPMFIIAIIFIFVRKFYLKTAQNIKRLEGVAKSPVFSHITSTLNGLTTIRSTGKANEALLKKQFDTLQNVHTGNWYLTIVVAETLGLYLDLVASCFIAIVCLSLILLNNGSTYGGDAGLAISQALIISGTLQYGVRQSAEVIAQMTAVERVLQYTDLPKEGPLTSDDPPAPTWPPKGQLTLENVSMRYDKDDPPVLKNLNITIEPSWKIGVVGRTGAGKSSLISALFHLYADGLEGNIKIDGRNTNTLGLQELRSRISIIPQEPVLFSESLRFNLDPLNQYDDSILWEVLREVELTDSSLDRKVLQNGNNFSVGQRQLICLARAILRNNRILVLDEATANIDTGTDTLIQNTIRTKFADCTVITIAHRLNTIIDSDRIIVMDNGRIVEFGCPYEILRDKPKGPFAQMVQKTGRVMAQTLFEQAKIACLKNHLQRTPELSNENSLCDNDSTTNDLEYKL